MKILWLSPRLPLPDHTGACKATLALLEELVNAGKELQQEVSLQMVFVTEELPTPEIKTEIEKRVQSKNNLFLKKEPLLMGSMFLSFAQYKMRLGYTPFTIARCTSEEIKLSILQWNAERTWDFTVIDGLHAASFVDLNDKRFGKLIYRAHNVETDLWEQLYQKEKNPLKYLIFKKEYELFKNYEKNVCQKSFRVLTVSQTDANRMEKLGFTQSAISLPIGIRMPQMPMSFANSEKIELLFVGRLDWHPNKEGLLWFLNEVWPHVDQNKMNLTIIGSGQSQYLESYQTSHLKIFRNVPDLKPYYEKSHMTLIPLFMGSGTRVKAIESGSFGRSFISTELGIEGVPVIPGSEYIQANTRAQWIEFLNTMTVSQAEKLGEAIFKKTKATFEQGSLAQNFINKILERKSWEKTSAI